MIIAKLEEGFIPWKKPWNALGPASSYISKKPYRGINQLILNSLHHTYPYYLTFKQASGLGGKVKKGSRAIPVTYWNFIFFNKDSGKKITEEEARRLAPGQVKKSAFLRYYAVFNISDVEGVDFKLPSITEKPENKVFEDCEQIVNNMPQPPQIRHEMNEAFYSPIGDYINMPKLQYFENSAMYYSVLFHELTHAAGHAKRLARPEVMDVHKFGSLTYGKEELTAEMGSSFLNGFAGIQCEQTIEDSARYIQGWLRKLKDDKTFVIEAAGKAQKATDYILKRGN